MSTEEDFSEAVVGLINKGLVYRFFSEEGEEFLEITELGKVVLAMSDKGIDEAIQYLIDEGYVVETLTESGEYFYELTDKISSLKDFSSKESETLQ